jgi:methylglutaconyl-CoA hydratase
MGGVEFDADGRGVATLTLNRPESFNSLDPATVAAFVAHLDRCERDAAIRLVCLKANGKHFCAGADVRKLPGPGAPAEAGGDGPNLPTLLRRLNELSRPTVALAQGACIGGGAGLIACCDVVIAETSAFVTISEVRLGIPPAALIPYFAAAIGPRRLRRYALSGERIDAARCLEIGFFHEVCQPGALAAASAPVIDALLLGAPGATAKTKRLVAEAAPVDLSAEREAALLAELEEIAAAPEAKEGIAAFLEKRSPGWYRAA